MKTTDKNTITINKNALRDSILKSQIASFRIENINITESVAQEILKNVGLRTKKLTR
jgi:hypothetical protein